MMEDMNMTGFMLHNCTYDATQGNGTWQNMTGRSATALEIASRTVVYTMVGLIMLAMGCGITVEAMDSRMRKPFSIVVGLSCQFILMPAIGFGLAHVLRLECYHAVGMVMVASCPGGTLSNLFTFWSKGDLPLSVCMTGCSVVLAVGLMPMNMFIYMSSWVDPLVHVPWRSTLVAIVSTWIPVAIGILIRNKAPLKVAVWIIRIGSVSGMMLIFTMGIIQKYQHPEIFLVSWNVWVATIALPVCGGFVGLLVSKATCRSLAQTKSIAYETGIQNAGIAITIVIITYHGPIGGLFAQFPIMYGVSQLGVGGFFTGLSIAYYFIKGRIQKRDTTSERRKSSVVQFDLDPIDLGDLHESDDDEGYDPDMSDVRNNSLQNIKAEEELC